MPAPVVLSLRHSLLHHCSIIFFWQLSLSQSFGPLDFLWYSIWSIVFRRSVSLIRPRYILRCVCASRSSRKKYVYLSLVCPAPVSIDRSSVNLSTSSVSFFTHQFLPTVFNLCDAMALLSSSVPGTPEPDFDIQEEAFRPVEEEIIDLIPHLPSHQPPSVPLPIIL